MSHTQAPWPDPASIGAGGGVRLIVELEAGKLTLRLKNLLRVIDALGDEVPVTYS